LSRPSTRIRPRVLLLTLVLALLGAGLCIGTSRRARVFYEARRLRSQDPVIVRAAYDHLLAIGSPWTDGLQPELVATRLTLATSVGTRWFRGSVAAVDSSSHQSVRFKIEEILSTRTILLELEDGDTRRPNGPSLPIGTVVHARMPASLPTPAPGKDLLVRLGPDNVVDDNVVVEDLEALEPGSEKAMTEALRERLAQLGR
jgi:hypothetical protein